MDMFYLLLNREKFLKKSLEASSIFDIRSKVGGLCDGCGWMLSSLTNAWMLFYEAKLFQMNKRKSLFKTVEDDMPNG